MGLLISASDFTGKHAIPQSLYEDLDDFIEPAEETYLIELLGAEMFKAFKADVNSTTKIPNSDKYKAIYNKFSEDYNDCLITSKGMKDMLKGFFYAEYMRQVKYKATTQGIVINAPDTSKTVAYGSLYLFYNEAVDTYQAIQLYIRQIKPEDYTTPKFNGVFKDISISIFE